MGTTLYCFSDYKNRQVEIIANDKACLMFTNSENQIGEAAKNEAAVNPERTIFHFIRPIGRN